MAVLPYATGNDLPEGVRAQVIDLLNQRLADSIDLATQTKQAHWTGISRGVDKWLWFVEAHVQSRAKAARLSLKSGGGRP